TMTPRGVHRLPSLRIASCFPINFFVRYRRQELQQQMLVFPRPLVATVPDSAGDSRQAQQKDLPQSGIDGELRGIDNYRDTDPLKSIHWKLSARHDEYKVKRQHRLGAPSLVLDLEDFSGPLEDRLGRCSFLVDQLSRQQRAVGLRLGEQFFPPRHGTAHRHKLLTELALYGQC
ncbi:MAG: DUF58 domain-containing protein, partial [Geopsychrobacter sp.]|nr:DUF58 domain-containing protein [Geopsychrobacter sp.]